MEKFTTQICLLPTKDCKTCDRQTVCRNPHLAAQNAARNFVPSIFWATPRGRAAADVQHIVFKIHGAQRRRPIRRRRTRLPQPKGGFSAKNVLQQRTHTHTRFHTIITMSMCTISLRSRNLIILHSLRSKPTDSGLTEGNLGTELWSCEKGCGWRIAR